jgi:hypothetical protein
MAITSHTPNSKKTFLVGMGSLIRFRPNSEKPLVGNTKEDSSEFTSKAELDQIAQEVRERFGSQPSRTAGSDSE